MSYNNEGGNSASHQAKHLQELAAVLDAERDLVVLLRQHDKLRFVRELWAEVPKVERSGIASQMLLMMVHQKSEISAATLVAALGEDTLLELASEESRRALAQALVDRAADSIASLIASRADQLSSLTILIAQKSLGAMGTERARQALADER